MMRKLALASFLTCLAAPALAGTGTITVKDSAGVTQTFDVVTDGSSHFLAMNVICDQSAGATCASVGTAGSPSTNALTIQAVTLGHGTAANAIRVELPTDGTGVVNAAQSGSWTATVTQSTSSNLKGQMDPLTVATWGLGAPASAAPTNAIQVGGTDGTNLRAFSTDGSGRLILAPNTPLKLNALGTSVTAIKGSGGQLFLLQCGNTNTTEGYVQIFNVASGSVTLGVTSPTLSVPIAAAATGGFALPQGISFGTAMSAAVTTTATGSSAMSTAFDCNVVYN